MKKNCILITLFFTTSFTSNLFAQVPNGGFENWFENYLYSEPLPYSTSNFQSFLVTGQANVNEVSGQSDSAVRLETVTDGNEIVSGALLLTNSNNGNLAAGFPFTSSPDSLTGYFKYDIEVGDTASIFLIFTSNSIPLNFVSIPIVGESLDFTYHAFELPSFISSPDSVAVLVSSSNFDTPIVGSWLEIDNLLFTNSTDQLPNNDFDDWTAIEPEDPEDWFTTNYFSALSSSPLAVTKSTDSYSDDFAMRIETVAIGFFESELDTVGYATTGSIGDNGPEGGFPYNEQPDILTGYYKYAPVGNDTALVNVIFTKYNAGTGETDILFEQTIKLEATNNYTNFIIPVTLDEIPDTANITFASSNFEDENASNGIGSVLLIDAVQFELIEKTKTPLFKDEALVFPNPASDYTTLDLNSVKGEVQSIIFFDALGRKTLHIKNPEQFAQSLKVNTTQLNNGIHLYLISTDLGGYTGKLQIER